MNRGPEDEVIVDLVIATPHLPAMEVHTVRSADGSPRDRFEQNSYSGSDAF